MTLIKRLSIPVIAAISVVGVTTFVLGGFEAVNYFSEQERRGAALHEKLATATDQLSAGLSIAIWNIDRTQINKIIESAMTDPNIYEVRVNAADEVFLRRRGPDETLLQSDALPPDPDLMTETRPVVFAGEEIGKVEVRVTPKLEREALAQSSRRYALMILLVDATLIASLYFILWRTVLKPLRQVERYAVAVSSGPDARVTIKDSRFHGELETLRGSIEKMVHLLESRIFEIQESEERYRTVFSVEPDTLLVIDLESLRILDANEAATAMYGLERQELLKLSVLELSGEREKTRMEFAGIRAGQFPTFTRRQHRRKDGTSFPVDIAARGFIFRGSVTVVAAIRDVSDRIRTENALYAAKERAESADMIKSEFLDIAAHELKTPLTPLTVLLQLARGKFQAGQPISSEIWERMSLQVERLTALVKDLLDVSRLERGSFPVNLKKVDLNQLVSQCIQDFRDQEQRRRIIFENSRDPIEIEADPVRIYEVVANLVDNALKYTPEETPIEAKVAALPGGRVRVAVIDHGQGISPEKRQALFSRFFRVSSDATRKHSGLGLGLYICRRILELHHGSIGVDSKPGQGSTFYFELPGKAA
jgi:PAS domain S-box-containing protein